MPRVRATDGAELHYEVHGRGAMDVLLLHGMGGARSTWNPVLEHLGQLNIRAIVPDLRGHGRSGGEGDSFSYPQLQSDLLAIAAAAGVEACIVVGFSGSCKNAVWFAAEAPERTRGVMLLAPPGMDCVPIPRETLAMFFETLEKTQEFPRELDGWFTPKIETRRAGVVRAFARTRRSVLEASAELWIHSSVVAAARRVTQPVVVIAGRHDASYSPVFQQQTTLQQLPRAKMEVLDCGHFVPCEEAAAVAKSLACLVAECESTPIIK